MLDKILVEDLVVLYARSGLGKTSLINAGLMEPLRARNFFPVMIRLQTGSTTTGDPLASIYASLEAAIAAAQAKGIITDYGWEQTTLWEYIKTLELWSAQDILLTPVLILDQFEELFTLYGREAARP